MGINIKIKNAPKPLDAVTVQAKLERDLKSCMRCRYFYGNNRQCIAEQCVKEEQKQVVTEQEKESKCYGCPYRQSENYCFPCMVNILGKKVKVNESVQEEKDG